MEIKLERDEIKKEEKEEEEEENKCPVCRDIPFPRIKIGTKCPACKKEV